VELNLAGKTAVVTGASRGIGLAVTQALVDAGAHVIAGSRTCTPALEELQAAGKVTCVPADLSTPTGPTDLVSAADGRGGIDVLVNNAGAVTVRLGGFATLTDADWQACWDLNVMGVVRTTRAALPAMHRRGGGAIVIVGSVNAQDPSPGAYDYNATKAAVTNIAKALSKELGPKNIRVNTVSPGPVTTGMWLDEGGMAPTIAGASGQTADQVMAAMASTASTGRFTTPEEVADLVVFLASARAANITGSDLRIDGGTVTTI